MLASVGQLLPIAAAAALSSVPITIMIVILLSPRRAAAALPYLWGIVVGTSLVVAVAALLASSLPRRTHRQDPWIGGIEIGLGLALLVLATLSWRRRSRVDHAAASSRWASVVGTLTPARAFGLGLLIDVRPKSLLLATVVGLQVHQSRQDAASAAALAAIYVVVATSTVTVPIVLMVLAPARMEPRLSSAHQLLTTQGPVISAVVLAVVAVVLLAAGLQNL